MARTTSRIEDYALVGDCEPALNGIREELASW